MCKDTVKGKNVDIKLWTPAHDVESTALDQLKNIAALPWTFHHVAVMPDVHYGKGATVGGFTSDKERDEAMTAVSDEDIAWVRPGRERSGTAKNLARRRA